MYLRTKTMILCETNVPKHPKWINRGCMSYTHVFNKVYGFHCPTSSQEQHLYVYIRCYNLCRATFHVAARPRVCSSSGLFAARAPILRWLMHPEGGRLSRTLSVPAAIFVFASLQKHLDNEWSRPALGGLIRSWWEALWNERCCDVTKHNFNFHFRFMFTELWAATRADISQQKLPSSSSPPSRQFLNTFSSEVLTVLLLASSAKKHTFQL